jgi:hypothetical protein
MFAKDKYFSCSVNDKEKSFVTLTTGRQTQTGTNDSFQQNLFFLNEKVNSSTI